jgi:hypothetical protein
MQHHMLTSAGSSQERANMKALNPLLAGALLCAANPVLAQEDSAGDIARMLVTELSPTRSMESGQWFTSAPSGAGSRGLGIIYVHVPGSAGTVSIHAALFTNSGAEWLKNRDVTGLFGYSPRDATFYPDRVELTTTTLGPNDPRCCPTKLTR